MNSRKIYVLISYFIFHILQVRECFGNFWRVVAYFYCDDSRVMHNDTSVENLVMIELNTILMVYEISLLIIINSELKTMERATGNPSTLFLKKSW